MKLKDKGMKQVKSSGLVVAQKKQIGVEGCNVGCTSATI
jgi:hypothetical protein